MTTPASRTDRFFVNVNRLVSLLLLLVLLGLLGSAAVLGAMSLGREPVTEPDTAKVEEKTEEAIRQVVLGFGDAEEVAGADVDMVRLVAEEGGRGYGSTRSGETRNVLFIRRADERSQWLFKDHKNVVKVIRQFDESDKARQVTRTIAHYVEYTTQQAGDGAANPGRTVLTVALVKPDGTGMTAVLKDVTRVLSCRVVEGRRMSVLFLRGTALRQATVALDDFTVSAEREVATLPTAI